MGVELVFGIHFSVMRNFLLLITLFVFISCSKEPKPKGEGYFIYDGITYELADAYLSEKYTTDDGIGVYPLLISKGFEVTSTSLKGTGNALILRINPLINSDEFLGSFEIILGGAVSGAHTNSSSGSNMDIYFSAGNLEIIEYNNSLNITFTLIEKATGIEVTGEWQGAIIYR